MYVPTTAAQLRVGTDEVNRRLSLHSVQRNAAMKSFPTSLAAVAACLCAAAAAAAAAAPLDSFLPPQPTVATGGDLQPPFTVTDADACANACLANASCVSFSLDQTQQPPTKTCGIVEECYAQNASTCPSNLVLSCVGGTFTSVSFASFGLPLIEPGQCAFAATPNCSAPSSVDVLTRACVGKSWCSIDAEVATFGADPCQGTVKFLAASLVGAGCSAQPPPPAPLTCTLSGYSRIYTIEGGNSSTRAYYQRLMPRNDAPFSQAVPYLLDVPRGNVSIREGHVLRTAFDNGILYLTQHYTVDDVLFDFRKRAGNPNPPGACHGWDCERSSPSTLSAALTLTCRLIAFGLPARPLARLPRPALPRPAPPRALHHSQARRTGSRAPSRVSSLWAPAATCAGRSTRSCAR